MPNGTILNEKKKKTRNKYHKLWNQEKEEPFYIF